MMDQIDDAIEKVEKQIPSDFPENIAEPIFKGMYKQRERYVAVSDFSS